ncbi:MAG: Fe-S cluster assembly protein SufD [Pseudomonadota bacterium]
MAQPTKAEESLMASLPDGEVAELLRAQGLPHRRVEAWKWSDLRAAAREERAASLAYQAHLPARSSSEVYAEVHLANGECQSSFDFLSQRPAEAEVLVQSAIASMATAAPIYQILWDEVAPKTMRVRRFSDGHGYHADRVKIVVEEGVTATLIESHEAVGAPFANSLTEIHLKPGAHLTRIVIQPLAPEALLIHTTLPVVEGGATYRQTTMGFGAHFARHEMHMVLRGTAEVQVDTLYRLDGKAHTDFTSHIHHQSPDCKVDQLCKGVVDGEGKAVFQGKFLVDQIAQRTDAKMAHHALLVSDRASVNAKPELEIYADEVECAHGNTAGALDGEALFYLQQRGLSANEARRLLIEAFGAEVLDRVEDEALRAELTTLFRGAE